MNVLDSVLREEYERLQRICAAMDREHASLPKGYISIKRIGGREYPYIQWREGKKIAGRYVSAADAELLRDAISRRQSLEKSIRECKARMKKLEKVL